jgi:Lon protease-like protein
VTEVHEMPMFPLGSVLFPGGRLPLHIFEPRYREMTRDCLEGDGRFGVVLITRGSEVGGGDSRVGVGTIARIEAASPFSDGRWLLVAQGERRFEVRDWLGDDPYPRARVELLAPRTLAVDDGLTTTTAQRVRRVRALLSELGESPALEASAFDGLESEQLCWQLCAQAPLNLMDSQRLLEVDDHGQRLSLLSEFCDALSLDLERLLGGATPA